MKIILHHNYTDDWDEEGVPIWEKQIETFENVEMIHTEYQQWNNNSYWLFLNFKKGSSKFQNDETAIEIDNNEHSFTTFKILQ